MAYLIRIKPFENPEFNYLEILNEYTFSILTIFMLIFSDYNNDPYAKYNYGWVFISILILNLGINFYGMLHKIIKDIIRYFKLTIKLIKLRMK